MGNPKDNTRNIPGISGTRYFYSDCIPIVFLGLPILTGVVYDTNYEGQ